MLREADRHLERVIYRAIQDVKLAGRNNTIQNEVAVRTVRWIRPEMLPALSDMDNDGGPFAAARGLINGTLLGLGFWAVIIWALL